MAEPVCTKAPHVGFGYMHSPDDDGPFWVDGIVYCGRCHNTLCPRVLGLGLKRGQPEPEPPSVTAALDAKDVTFQISGTPAAWARARTNRGRHFTSEAQLQAQGSVEAAFVSVAPQEWKPHEGPVHARIVCHFLAPKDYWEGKACTKRPDLDNLCKLVGDALNGVAYRDDAQIVRMSVEKCYTEGCERTEVTLTFLPAVPKPKKARSSKKLERELVGALRGPGQGPQP